MGFSRLTRPANLAIFIALTVGAVYSRVCTCDFINWDDGLNVFTNPHLAHVDLQSLVHFWVRPYQSLYIPVAYMAYALVSVFAHTGGGAQVTQMDTDFNPHVFHTANLIAHMANSVLAFVIIRKLCRRDLPAAGGALLFALHPLQVEPVAWVSEFRGLVSAFFGLGAMAVYLFSARDDGKYDLKYLTGSATLFALSLLAKPTAVMIPVVLLVWETLWRREPLRITLLRLSPWFALALGDSVVTHFVQSLRACIAVPLVQRPIVMLDSYGFYLSKIFWPAGLSIEYGRSPQRMLAGHWFYATAPWLLAAAYASTVSRRRFRWAVPCLLTFLAFLLPNSGMVVFTYQLFSTVADRYAYLAMLGPALAVSFALSEVTALTAQRISFCFTAVILTALCIRTKEQTALWTDTRTLFANAEAVNPADWLPHEKLGAEDMLAKDYVDAERQYRITIADGPVDSKFWVELGAAVQDQKRYVEAIADDNRSLAINPGYPVALYHRAECEALLGASSASITDYRASVDRLPPTSYAHFELAMELGSVGRFGDAATEFARNQQLHPDFLNGYYYLAMTYARIGRPKLAQDVARIALAIDPNYAPVYPYVSVAAQR